MFDFLKILKKKKYKRFVERMGFKVLFRFQYGNVDRVGVINDISLTGFGFSSAKEILQGKEIDAEIILDCKNCDLDLKEFAMTEKAKVKWVGPNRSMNLLDYDAGCEFTKLNEMNQEKLKKFLDVMIHLSED